MSEKDNDKSCNCNHESRDEVILIGQSQAKCNMANEWLVKGNHAAAEAHLNAARRLLALSGRKDTSVHADYFALRGAIAQAKGHNKAALAHARKSLKIYTQTSGVSHHSTLVTFCNVGEMTAVNGSKQKGLAMMAEGLEKLKGCDVGQQQWMLDWKEQIVKQISDTMTRLSTS